MGPVGVGEAGHARGQPLRLGRRDVQPQRRPIGVVGEEAVAGHEHHAPPQGRFGAVHVVCHNAGVAAPLLRAPAWESALEDWRWMLDVNFMGALHGVRAFVPRMLAGSDEGHVVNTAPVAGLLTEANPYSVSMHAVACLTEGLYKDLKAIHAPVSASVLCPGVVRTAILDGGRNRDPADGPPAGESGLDEEGRRWTARFRAAPAGGPEPAAVAAAVAEATVQTGST